MEKLKLSYALLSLLFDTMGVACQTGKQALLITESKEE